MPFERLIIRLLHGVHLVARPLTMGVRGAVFDAQGRVFLVRHTYVPGWYLPGGGVDPGETVADALKREFMEEANIELLDEPELRSVHFNAKHGKRDHVLFFRCGAFRQNAPKTPDVEIAETGWFDLGTLPEETTPATCRRLAELEGAALPDPHW